MSVNVDMDGAACLVLMFKAPARSKRRMAAGGSTQVTEIAACLLDCALEDLAGWPGSICYAPADDEARTALGTKDLRPGLWVDQGDGNLGERIEHVNRRLLAAGASAQIFIGIDCPALEPDYLDRAGRALAEADVVLGPARDGGVVLMGVNGRWPALGHLPWSRPALNDALRTACEQADLRCATLPTLADLDTVADLAAIGHELAADRRPARRALRALIDPSTARSGAAS